MKFSKKIIILSNGSLYFCQELAVFNNNKFVSCSLEDEKNFYFNRKKKLRPFYLKSSLKYKKKYFK